MVCRLDASPIALIAAAGLVAPRGLGRRSAGVAARPRARRPSPPPRSSAALRVGPHREGNRQLRGCLRGRRGRKLARGQGVRRRLRRERRLPRRCGWRGASSRSSSTPPTSPARRPARRTTSPTPDLDRQVTDLRSRRDRTVTRTHAQTGSLRLSTAGVAAWLARSPAALELPVLDGTGRVGSSTPARSTRRRASRAAARLGERRRAARRRPDALLGVPVGRPARVDDALVLGQRVDLRPLLVAELEVEDLEVLDPPLVARGLRDRGDLRLVEQPAQRDLAGGLAVRVADRAQRLVLGTLPRASGE